MAGQRKILFLEDDEEYAETLSELLELEGFQILNAYCVDEAEQILDEAWAHFAVIDLSMTGEADNRDGLKIVNNPAYAAIPKVILTGFGNDPALVRETLRTTPGMPPPVVDFIGKNSGAIDRTLIEAFESHVRINWDLQIEWTDPALSSPTGLAGYIVPAEDRANLAHRVNELEDLLRQIFAESQRLLIGRLFVQQPGLVWLEAVALGAHGSAKELIVACGQKQLIQQQNALYDHYVPQAATVGSLRRVETSETLRFGAALFECIGGQLTDLTPMQGLHWRRPTAEIEPVLEQFLATTLDTWHEQGRSGQDVADLQQLFKAWAEATTPTDPEVWAAKVRDLCAQGPTVQGMPLRGWIARHLPQTATEDETDRYETPFHFLEMEGANLSASLAWGTVHGNLCLENILVDRAGGTAWLVDFSHVRAGLLLWDFVSLEAALKRELLAVADFDEWCGMAAELLGVDSLHETPAGAGSSPEVQKVLALIRAVRSRAALSVGGDVKSYVAGLFVHALVKLAGYEPEKCRLERQRIPYILHLLTAAMACQHLTTPRQFEPDFAGAFVLVEGQKKGELSEQEWKVLQYLYERAGRPCRYEDILLDVYEEAADDVQDGAWMRASGRGKVNAAIGRMRKKLEPNPKNPRYIRTAREQGYWLQI